MKYSFIEEHQKEFAVREQCPVLEVSSKGLVARKRRSSPRTTDSRHQFPVAPHYLQRRFGVQEIEGR